MSRNLVFMGTGAFALEPLKALFESLSPLDRLTVYTKAPKKAGRGMKLQDGCVASFAREKGLPLYQPASLRTPEERERFLAIGAELVIVASYGLILPDYVIHAPQFGCVNLHASLLPRYRGAAPINRAIMEGETKTGVTLMQMDEGLDTGDILWQKTIVIEPDENAGALFEKLALLSAQMIVEALPRLFDGAFSPEKQDDARATYAAKIQPEDRRLDFCDTTEKVLRRIRGLAPHPAAACTNARDGATLKILSAKKAEGAFDGQRGVIIAVKPGVIVKTKDGAVELVFVQPEGKAPMPARDAVNGRKLQLFDQLI